MGARLCGAPVRRDEAALFRVPSLWHAFQANRVTGVAAPFMCGLKSAVAAAGLWRGPALAGAAGFSPTPWQEGPRAGSLPLPSLGIPRRSSAMWRRKSRADASGTRSSRTPCPTGSSNTRFRLRSTRTLWMRMPFCTQKTGGLPRGSSQVPRLPGLLPRRDFRPRIICVQNGLLVQLGRDSARHTPTCGSASGVFPHGRLCTHRTRSRPPYGFSAARLHNRLPAEAVGRPREPPACPFGASRPASS